MKQLNGPTKKNIRPIWHAECPDCGSKYEIEDGDKEIKSSYDDGQREWSYWIVCPHCGVFVYKQRWTTVRSGGWK